MESGNARGCRGISPGNARMPFCWRWSVFLAAKDPVLVPSVEETGFFLIENCLGLPLINNAARCVMYYCCLRRWMHTNF